MSTDALNCLQHCALDSSDSFVHWYGYNYQTKLNHCHRTFSASLWSEMHFVYVKLYSVNGCFEHASISGIVEELIWHSTVLETKQNTNSTIVTYLQFCLFIFNCICVRSTFSAYFMILFICVYLCMYCTHRHNYFDFILKKIHKSHDIIPHFRVHNFLVLLSLDFISKF